MLIILLNVVSILLNISLFHEVFIYLFIYSMLIILLNIVSILLNISLFHEVFVYLFIYLFIPC